MSSIVLKVIIEMYSVDTDNLYKFNANMKVNPYKKQKFYGNMLKFYFNMVKL